MSSKWDRAALKGVKVLDLTRMHAGPFAAMVLADLGADVVKVEPPVGDATRSITQYAYGPQSAFFVASNRNKEAIVLDLKAPADRRQFDRLLTKADVLIDNFRPGTLRRLGLHYDDISNVNQRLICVSVTGYGEDTPSADLPAYDLLAQAQGGVMALTGEPNGGPIKCGVPIGDLQAGVYAALGTIAALYERERTGSGQRVEVAMLDAQVAFLHYHLTYHHVAGKRLPRVGSEHHAIVPYGVFDCGDGKIAMAVLPEPPKFWESFCRLLDRPEWLEDKGYATGAARVQNRQQLRRDIEDTLRTGTRAHWLERLRAAGVPAAPMNEIDDLADDPQVEARRMIVDMTTTYGNIRVAGNPVKMQGAVREEDWRAPPLFPKHHEGLDGVIGRWGLELGDDNDPMRPMSPAHIAVLENGKTGALRGWRCSECRALAFGIRHLCPVCGVKKGTETRLASRGKLETWSRVASASGAYLIGYALVSDDVDDQEVRVFGRMELDPEKEGSLRIGTEIQIRFRQAYVNGQARLVYAFVPIPNPSVNEVEALGGDTSE